jgi:hypothetical protein
MTKNYEDYVAKVTTLGADEVAKPAAVKAVESYNNMAASFANTDKIKAIEYFNKTIDPANKYAVDSIKILK